jgi:hypothetical protein
MVAAALVTICLSAAARGLAAGPKNTHQLIVMGDQDEQDPRNRDDSPERVHHEFVHGGLRPTLRFGAVDTANARLERDGGTAVPLRIVLQHIFLATDDTKV